MILNEVLSFRRTCKVRAFPGPKTGDLHPSEQRSFAGDPGSGAPSICGRDESRSRMLQVLDFGQQLRCFVFKLRPLRDKIFFRVFAGAELEVQVAEIRSEEHTSELQ